jgi:hypothetical protein
MVKILKLLWIIQEKTFTDNDLLIKKRKKRRLNPFNPLTYIVLLILLSIGLLMFGFVGLKDEVNWEDLKFKWN